MLKKKKKKIKFDFCLVRSPLFYKIKVLTSRPALTGGKKIEKKEEKKGRKKEIIRRDS